MAGRRRRPLTLPAAQVTADCDTNFFLQYKDVFVGDPVINEELDVESASTPMACRLRNLTWVQRRRRAQRQRGA